MSEAPPAVPRYANDFRLPGVLKKRRDAEGGNLQLERAIQHANEADPTRDPEDRTTVDRRKLKALIEAEEDVPLYLSEIRALNRYLERFGESLSANPIMEVPDLYRTLADSGPVTFLLGFKETKSLERQPSYLAHWDVWAMAEVQRSIDRSDTRPPIDIREVRLDESQEEARGTAMEGEWTAVLKDRGPSLVVPGSSRAVPATERLLCEMFGCRPFRDASPEEKAKLPFHFVWSEQLRYVFHSPFRKQPGDIAGEHPEAAREVEDGNASALVTPDGVFVDRVHKAKHGDTYGICAAQRRKGGQIWLVLAGVTGAATLVAAHLASGLAPRIELTRKGENSPVYWAAVTARVDRKPKDPLSGRRKFEAERFVSGPWTWPG